MFLNEECCPRCLKSAGWSPGPHKPCMLSCTSLHLYDWKWRQKGHKFKVTLRAVSVKVIQYRRQLVVEKGREDRDHSFEL